MAGVHGRTHRRKLLPIVGPTNESASRHFREGRWVH